MADVWRSAVCVITGANGYVGRRLAARLLTQTAVSRIVLFDVASPVRDPDPLPTDAAAKVRLLERCVKSPGDIRDPKHVAAAFAAAFAGGSDESKAKGRDLIVFHVASYGMSGKEQVADPKKVMAINVQGTQHIIDECQRHSGARRVLLVYTSTFNTVFGESDRVLRRCIGC
jgi:nucleoside-diphosphate-sugar epimerase